MSRASKKSTKPAVVGGKLIASTRDLGAALGLTHVTAARWIKHAEWPFGPGPWSAREVPAMKQWAVDTLRPANEPDKSPGGDLGKLSPLNKVRFKKIVRETEGIEIRNKVLAGDYVDRAESEARHCTVLEMIKRRLMTMPNRLPFDEAIKDVVRRHVREEFDLLAGGSK